MPKIVMYTTEICPYCMRAKTLLNKLNLSFEEINLSKHPEKREEMLQKSEGRTSVPQIFINQEHIGGSDELHALYKSGGLDKYLQEEA